MTHPMTMPKPSLMAGAADGDRLPKGPKTMMVRPVQIPHPDRAVEEALVDPVDVVVADGVEEATETNLVTEIETAKKKQPFRVQAKKVVAGEVGVIVRSPMAQGVGVLVEAAAIEAVQTSDPMSQWNSKILSVRELSSILMRRLRATHAIKNQVESVDLEEVHVAEATETIEEIETSPAAIKRPHRPAADSGRGLSTTI